ncbi:MAG: HAD family hydrolase [Eubacteriales bacterium]|nr:HAD family hydrolase [Eubacteriales bacterium]
MWKACIFDLDGTLADTVESMAYVANGILESFGLPAQPVEKYKYYCGEGAEMLMKRCLLDAGDTELNYWKEGSRRYRQIFAEDPMYRVTHYPGMPETLWELKRKGARLAVCSNKPHTAAVKVIDTMFKGVFDMVLGQQEGIRRKPFPDAPLKIAEALGVRPEECLYVGDTATDMQTGRAAGMYTIGALWGFRTREELSENHADVLAESPEDILDIYEENAND